MRLLIKIIIVALTIFYLAGFRINLSPSMPIGLYAKDNYLPLKRGTWIAVCLDDEIAAQGFLHTGSCPNHSMPILKEIIALPWDIVEYKDDTFFVNDKKYYAPQASHIKNHIAQKKYLSFGYWLYGSNSPVSSWDSRYFGEVAKENIIGIYEPVITYPSKTAS